MRKSLGKLIRASSQMYEILWGNRLRITKDDNLFAFEPLGDRIQINSPFLITGLNNIIYNDLGATPMLKRSKTGTQLVDDKSTSCAPVSFPEEVAFYTGAQVHGLLEFGDHNSRAPDFNMITATPGPVILSGVSFGGGAAVSESWAWNQLHPARPVNQLMLFDPVTPNTVPYPEDYVGDHLMNFNYDQVNNRITSGYSYFVVPSNLNARSWWQPFTEEDLPANHVYGQLGVATGYVSTNGLDQGPNGPAPSGPNEIIGTYHASQVFISSVLLEAANIMTGYVDQWHT